MLIVIAIIAIFAWTMLVLLLRELVLWYLKINRMVELLQSIDLSLSLLPVVRDERIRTNKIPKSAA